MERPPSEFTFICIDNSSMVFKEDHTLRYQVEAVKFYCKTLFESNPDSAVILYLMTKTMIWIAPTRDLQEISSNLENVPCFGHLKFVYAMASAAAVFEHVPSNMNKRLLVFVASPIDLDSRIIHPVSCGKALGLSHVAVHVFKYPISKSRTDIEKRMRDYINLVVTSVNDGGKGSLMDVNGPLIDMLSESILEKNLQYLSKVAGNEMNRAPAVVRDTELTDISHISKMFGLVPRRRRAYVPPDRIPTIRRTYPKEMETQIVSKGDLSVKQELLLSCNEQNKIYSPPCAEEDVSAEKAEEEASVKQGSCNEKNKIYSPPCAEEDVSVKQGSCNEKNKAAAQGICNKRDDTNILYTCKVSYLDAILGTTVKVPTVDGTVDLKIPSGTQPGTTLVMAKKGVPLLNKSNRRGDQLVRVQVEIPKRVSGEEKKLIEELSNLKKGKVPTSSR